MNLQEIKDKMAKIKSDISRKEGEKSAVINDLKKEFSVKTVDEAYDLYDSLKTELEKDQIEKEKLTVSVEKQLVSYGY